MIRSEAELAGLAVALRGSLKGLTASERRIAVGGVAPSKKLLAATKVLIRKGLDPLGDHFCTLRTPEQRRGVGATYTPLPIVQAIVDWASQTAPLAHRVVDAGCGSGRFLINAARLFPNSKLIGVDIDPLATLLLRANAEVLDFSDRLTVKLSDYRTVVLPSTTRQTVYVGNPPYVRHHDIPEAAKAWFAETASNFGFKASKLAGLHIHFFLRTRQLAKSGDIGAFITAAEWIDVNYGSVLRKMLADGLGGVALHVIDPKAKPFADALTTGAITCFKVGDRPDMLTLRAVDSLDALGSLSDGRQIAWSAAEAVSKWTPLFRPSVTVPDGLIPLGDLFRVHRGQVTGSNAVWIAGDEASKLPGTLLRPAITRARELLNAGAVLTKSDQLKHVVDLPVDLTELSSADRKHVDRFLAWARRQNAHQSYIARHRRAWWSVGYREPAPILVTYMGRRPPHFTRNLAAVTHLNIAHGLYPRRHLSTEILDAVVAYLNRTVTVDGGRTYAGGLVKFEPKELEKLLIPRLETLHALEEPDLMDDRPAPRRRRKSDGTVQTRTSRRAA